MRFENTGTSISEVEVSNVSPHGIWLLINKKEYFLTYELYPWFEDAPIKKLFDVELIHGHHIHWPSLDIDLELDSLESPDSYPLIYR